MPSPSPPKGKKKKSRNWSVWEGTNASLWSWSPFPQQKQEVQARRNLKAAICQKHCEKLWGIHWKQMGFFSFNSEILSLSDTIKTNRGRRGMLSNRNTGWFEPSPWAPRVEPGRGPAGGAWVTWLGPQRRPQLHPWAPGRFAQWWVSGQGKCPPLRVHASPAPPPLRGP